MLRIPFTNGLRVPVLIVLALWLAVMAIMGFTRFLHPPIPVKALHFTSFGIMGVLVFFSFQPTLPRRKVWAITLGFTAIACFFSEVLQRLLTTRPFKWADIAANLLGSVMFLFAAWMVDRWIVQPKIQNANRYQDSARYWALDNNTDELDVELDEIAVVRS